MGRADLTPEQLAEQSKYEVLPTGKPHISFSELGDWVSCSFKHKLKHIDKLDSDTPSVHMDFGTAMHAACEQYVKTKVMDRKIFLTMLKSLWDERKEKYPEEYTSEAFTSFGKQGMSILLDVPAWLDKQFPGWEFVDAEHALYEPIEKYKHAFKGFIDLIIKTPGPKGKDVIWLLDWKTCAWGWAVQKKSDPMVRAQLILYKNYWSKKTNTDTKNIKCGFILLKRTGKPGAHCELVATSVGDVTTKRSLKVVNNMISSVRKRIAIKNRNSCTYCPFFNTEHCT